jgi:hypothetical protein
MTPSMTHDLREQIARIDEQIVDLLAQRVSLYEEAMENAEDFASSDTDIVADWEAMADERGWSMTTMANICRWVQKLCKSGVEE